jgi:hypothetical protein
MARAKVSSGADLLAKLGPTKSARSGQVCSCGESGLLGELIERALVGVCGGA